MKATICLLVGLAYTFGFATLTIGHLNILTITFLPMLIGLAIDFGVHLVTRYEEELRHGRSPEEALTKAMVFTGQGIFTGAFTTAGAFLAMSFTNFKGIQEMGVICGSSIFYNQDTPCGIRLRPAEAEELGTVRSQNAHRLVRAVIGDAGGI